MMIKDKNMHTFTSYKESGYKPLMIGLTLVSILEMPLMHFGLSLWNNSVAWFVTILTILSMGYFIWSYFDLKKNPISLDETYLYFHLGSRVRSKIKLTDIKEVINNTNLSYNEKREYLEFTPAIEFNTLLHFHTPQHFKTLFGKIYKGDKILIFVDDYGRFKKEIMKEKGK